MIENNKEKAISKIVVLALKHNISADEIGAVLVKSSLKDKSGSWLSNLMAYIGGAFIIAGLALLTGMIWEDLGSASRFIITYGPGIVAFILGVITVKDHRYEKASTPLFIISATLMPSGMFVFLKEYADGNDVQLATIIVFGLVAIQFLTTFYALKRTTLLFFGYLFAVASFGTLMSRYNVPDDLLGIGLGISILTFSFSIDKTLHRSISGFYYLLGGTGFLWSCFGLLKDFYVFDMLFLPLAIFMMLLSVRVKSRTLLIISTFSLLGYLGYFTSEYFANVTGWPIALIIMGFVLIGVSTKAIKLGQKISSSP